MISKDYKTPPHFTCSIDDLSQIAGWFIKRLELTRLPGLTPMKIQKVRSGTLLNRCLMSIHQGDELLVTYPCNSPVVSSISHYDFWLID